MKDFITANVYARTIIKNSLEKECPEISQAIKDAQERRSPIIRTKNPISETAKIILAKKGYEVTGEKEFSVANEFEKLISDEKLIETLLEEIKSSAEKRRQSQKI